MPKLDWTKPLELKQGAGGRLVDAHYIGKTPTGEVVVFYAKGCFITAHTNTGVSIYDSSWLVRNKLPAWEQAWAAEPDWGSNKAFYKAGWDAAMREHKSD